MTDAGLFWFALTCGLYASLRLMHARLVLPAVIRVLLHPVLLTAFVIAGLIVLFGTPLEEYQHAMHPLSYLLRLSVMALAVPLVAHFRAIRQMWRAALAALLVGSVVGVGSTVILAFMLNSGPEMVATVAVKSVTTPIAIVTAGFIGGIPEMAAAIVLLTGIFVGLIGPMVLPLLGVRDEVALGLTLGITGHGFATAEAFLRTQIMGASAAFAMAANGLLTAIFLPLIWP